MSEQMVRFVTISLVRGNMVVKDASPDSSSEGSAQCIPRHLLKDTGTAEQYDMARDGALLGTIETRAYASVR